MSTTFSILQEKASKNSAPGSCFLRLGRQEDLPADAERGEEYQPNTPSL